MRTGNTLSQHVYTRAGKHIDEEIKSTGAPTQTRQTDTETEHTTEADKEERRGDDEGEPGQPTQAAPAAPSRLSASAAPFSTAR